MRYSWVLSALFLAVSAQADPLPDDAYDRTVSQEDQRRLMRMFLDRSREQKGSRPNSYRERKENAERLRAELYAPSPDLAVIDQLHQRERELRRQDMERTDRLSERFIRSLSPEDRLKYLKMTYPPPVRIHIPDKSAAAGSK